MVVCLLAAARCPAVQRFVCNRPKTLRRRNQNLKQSIIFRFYVRLPQYSKPIQFTFPIPPSLSTLLPCHQNDFLLH